jgi:hypothetical protein
LTSSLDRLKLKKSIYEFDFETLNSQNRKTSDSTTSNYNNNLTGKKYYKTLSINRIEVNPSRLSNNNKKLFSQSLNNNNIISKSALSHRSNISLPLASSNNSEMANLDSPKKSITIHSNYSSMNSLSPNSNKENESIIKYRTSLKKLNNIMSKSSHTSQDLQKIKSLNRNTNTAKNNTSKLNGKKIKELNSVLFSKSRSSVVLHKKNSNEKENLGYLPPIEKVNQQKKSTENKLSLLSSLNTFENIDDNLIGTHKTQQELDTNYNYDDFEDDKTMITSITTTTTTLLNNLDEMNSKRNRNIANELIINLNLNSFNANGLFSLTNSQKANSLSNVTENNNFNSNENNFNLHEKSQNFDAELLDPDEYFYFNGYHTILLILFSFIFLLILIFELINKEKTLKI